MIAKLITSYSSLGILVYLDIMYPSLVFYIIVIESD